MKAALLMCLFLHFGFGVLHCQTSSSKPSSTGSASLEDSVFRYDSLPHFSDIALQFLAGEIAFNATSFSLWGDELYKGPKQISFGGGLGIVAPIFTVPLAIHFTTELLNVKSGSYWYGVAGAALGAFVLSPLFVGLPHQPTYLTRYLGTSIPIIAIAELAYDLSISHSWHLDRVQ